MSKLLAIVKNAESAKVAVGHFNVANLEMLKAVAMTAKKLSVPVIIGLSEGEREFVGVEAASTLIASLGEELKIHIFLNADHTYSLEKVAEAARAGYDSIVFDGSKLEFEENIKRTKEAVKIAKKIKKDILVEGELGYIGSGSKILKELPEGAAITAEDFTCPDEAARFVKETGVDMLAPAVGNIHGMFAGALNPKLDVKRIREVHKAAGVPLVLHGGSGISDEDFLAAIDAGISVIHISTELRMTWRKGLEASLKENPDEIAPYKLMSNVLAGMEKVIEKRLRLFNKI
jgi:fructose-bisphosphate aldolase class II